MSSPDLLAREIADALREGAEEAGETATQFAAAVGRSEPSARAYYTGAQVPSGDVLIRAMRRYPSIARRLGFHALESVHGLQD